MEILVKDINNLENTIAKYIYNKYIDNNKNLAIKNINEINKKKYKIYLQNIFEFKRKCFVLNQEDIIRDDLKTMNIADKALERNPDKFNVSNFDIPPDILRCSYIRKYHHRYYRCKNRISNDDSDVCKTHENSENIYYDNYNDILEQLKNN
jgi:hypothetical protein